MLVLFHDDENAGLFFTAHDAEQLIVRSKESHDGALPSGNSAAAYVLMRLARMTGNTAYEQRAENIAAAFGAQLAQHPSGSTVMLTALHFSQGAGQEIVLSGANTAAVSELARALRTRWLPQSVMLFRPAENAEDIIELAPHTASTLPINDEATAYVCRGFACELPVQSVDEMLALISGT
jgi:uncharacterized protein YyaL (SSP411 family)